MGKILHKGKIIIMITAIGLGNTGCGVVKKLDAYENYSIITIDSGKEIKEQPTPEDYENNCPDFKKLFKGINNEVFLFMSPAGKISGASLRILEQLKEKKVNVVCICSDNFALSSVGILQQKLVLGVLQEYARSGLIKNLYLIDNSKVESLLLNVSIESYYDEINELISFIFHTFMCFENLNPILQFGNLDNGIASIRTFSIINENGEQNKLFDLKNDTHEIFYFSHNKKINKNKNFLKDIKQFIEKQSNSSTKKVGSKIFETQSEDLNTYSLISTHIVQNKKFENTETT